MSDGGCVLRQVAAGVVLYKVAFGVKLACVDRQEILLKEKEKRGKKEKESILSGGMAGLQRSNAIKEGFCVLALCVYGGISLQPYS